MTIAFNQMRALLSDRHRRIAGRVALWTVVVLVLVYGVAVASLTYAMRQPPERFGRIMAHVPWVVFPVLPFESLWTWARAGQVGVGDAAPDFALSTADRRAIVRLSDFRGARPVVLVFGSYT